MTTTTETSPDLRRLASDRDWHGYLTLENLEPVAERMRKLLTGRSYSWVACNSGLRHYFPEVRAGQQLRDAGVTTYLNDNGGRYSAGITVPDTYGVWGLHTDVPDQATARKRRSEAWDEATEEQRRTDTWDDRDLTYLLITRDKIEIEHYAIIGYRLYWVITVEPRDDERDALVIAALDSAAATRDELAKAPCTDCAYTGDGPCPDQREHMERAAEYRAERDRLEAGRG